MAQLNFYCPEFTNQDIFRKKGKFLKDKKSFYEKHFLHFSKKTFDILVKSGIIIQGKVKKCKRKREKVL